MSTVGHVYKIPLLPFKRKPNNETQTQFIIMSTPFSKPVLRNVLEEPGAN